MPDNNTGSDVHSVSAPPERVRDTDKPPEGSGFDARKFGVEQIKDLRQDREERKRYARKYYWLVFIWIIAVIGLLLLHGFSFLGFVLSDNVLMVALGTTTVNVIGIVIVVAKYLFPERSSKHATKLEDSNKK